MNRETFLPTIPTLDGIYLIFSTATRCPYVVCNPETYDDEAMVCISEQAAEAKVKELRELDIPVSSTKVVKDAMLNSFNDMYCFGINAVRFVDDEDELCIQLTDFVHKGDISKIPEERRPLENPSLQLSMLYFCQEARYRGQDPKKVHEYEEEMVADIRKSTFLVPIAELNSDDEGKKEIKFMILKSKDKEPVVPVFTDTMTLMHFLGKGRCQVIKMNIDQLAKLEIPNATRGFIFNPNGVGLVLNREQMNKIIADF